MLSYSDLVSKNKNVNNNENIKKLLNDYQNIIDNIYLNHHKIQFKPKNNFRNNIKSYKKKTRQTYEKPSALKKILNENDSILNTFNGLINKLTNSNFDQIYNDVVNQFISYLSNFITDYVESYIKFGISGKCEIEDLNMDLIKEKYIQYQVDLWNILINKFINSNNSKIYFNFINHLYKCKTDIYNIKIIDKIKVIFKTYTKLNYDNINLNDDIDDNDALQFFKHNIITEITEHNKLIYNNITNIINIFTSYDFNLSNFTKINNEFIDHIHILLSNTEKYISIECNLYTNIINKYINNSNIEKIGYFYALYLLKNKKGNFNDLKIFINDFEELSKNNEMKNYFVSKAYLIIGLLDLSHIKNINLENKEETKNKISSIGSSLHSLIEYKLMDITDQL